MWLLYLLMNNNIPCTALREYIHGSGESTAKAPTEFTIPYTVKPPRESIVPHIAKSPREAIVSYPSEILKTPQFFTCTPRVLWLCNTGNINS